MNRGQQAVSQIYIYLYIYFTIVEFFYFYLYFLSSPSILYFFPFCLSIDVCVYGGGGDPLGPNCNFDLFSFDFSFASFVSEASGEMKKRKKIISQDNVVPKNKKNE